MKKIIISEDAEKLLLQKLINEELTYMGDKEDIVIQWLNNHFKAMEQETFGENGLPKVEKVVSVLDSKKQLTTKLMTLEKVFFILQSQFKKILQDKQERDNFLWNTLNKWYK